MLMDSKRSILTLVIALCAVAGFAVPCWQLAILAVLAAAISGRYALAVCLGLLLDIAYGVPVGVLHALLFPFTLLALITVGGAFVMSNSLRKKPADRLY